MGGFTTTCRLPYEIEYEKGARACRFHRWPTANAASVCAFPTFVVSPFIEPMKQEKVNNSKTIYDHTSIAATILRTFCYPHIPSLGARTNYAADVRELLTLDSPRPASDFDGLLAELQEYLSRPAPVLNGTIPAAPLRMPDVERFGE